MTELENKQKMYEILQDNNQQLNTKYKEIQHLVKDKETEIFNLKMDLMNKQKEKELAEQKSRLADQRLTV